MPDPINVAIGIQARSTSERLPRKAFEMIGNKEMLRHVIDACISAAKYINNKGNEARVSVFVLVPYDDEIVPAYRRIISIIEGPEADVLARYGLLAKHHNPDYLVRITADCPLIPSNVISKCISTAIHDKLDYLSNVDPRCRMDPDGYDCEVMSKRAFNWLQENASTDYDKEHVTPLLRREPPLWLHSLPAMGYLPLSHLKYSVDTQEDLEMVRAIYEQRRSTEEKAKEIYGVKTVKRI